MGRITLPKASITAQLTSVRRAASSAAVACSSDGTKLRSHLTKAQQHRDNLTAAAMTLSAIRDSQVALGFLPEAQRDQLAIRLAAHGFVAVRADDVVESREVVCG